MKIAFIFAGQGSQYIGMGKELYDNILICREAFDKERSLLDFDIKELMFNGEKEELDITENTQPAILATSIMAMKALEEKKITPSVVAGLSLGEYSALVSANALSFEEAIKLVRKRGRFMQEAVPIGVGSMIAIIGLSLEKIKIAIEEASSIGIVEIANYNTNNQIVIGGEKDAVEKVKELCFEFGARRVIELKVSGPFHTSLLEKASVKLKEESPSHFIEALKEGYDLHRTDVNKICFLEHDAFPFETVYKEFEKEFNVIHCTVPMFGDNSGELSVPGVNKQYAIDKLIKHLNIPKENTYAYGDGLNDIDMLEYCQYGIAVGNAKEALKEIADEVTEDIAEDGIYNSMKKHGLI